MRERVPRGGVKWKSVKQEFLAAQDGMCAICRTAVTPASAHLDHCHTTGMIRGILCASCNIKLGWLEKRRPQIERYLAHAAEFDAYEVAQRMTRSERLRTHYQRKAS